MDREFEELLKGVLKELKDLTVILRTTSKAAKQTAVDQRQSQEFHRREILRLKKEKEARKKTGEAYDDLDKEIEESTDAIESLGREAKKAGSSFGSLPKKFIEGIGKVVTNIAKTALMFSDVSRPVDSLTQVTEQLSEGMGIANKVAVGLANDFDTVRGSFVNLAKTGASFNGNLFALSQAAKDANIPLPKLTAFLQDNAATFGNFFGTVQGGTNEFIKLAAGLKSLTEKELSQFGVTTDETQEFLATLLEGERRRGNLQNFTAKELQNNTVHYTKLLGKLSALTGKSVDVLDEQNKAAMADSLFRASMADMDPKAAAVLQSAFSDAGPGLQMLIKDIKLFRNPVNKISQELAVAAPELVQATRDLIDNRGDDDALRRFNNAVGAAGKSLTGPEGKGFLLAAQATGQFAGVFDELIPKIRAQVSEDGLAGVLEQLSTSGKKAVNVFSQFDTLSADLQDKRIQAGLPATLAAAVAMGEGINELAKDDGFLDKMGQAINSVTEALGRLTSVLSPANIMKKIDKLGTKEGSNQGTIFSTGEDSIFGMTRRGGERLGEGGEGNSIIDILTPWDTLSEKLQKQAKEKKEFNDGSGGFRNFGTGTPAVLHGMEAVVPQNTTLGKIIQLLEKTSTGSSVAEATSGASMSDTYLAELVELNRNTQRALNTLVTIGAMTEKNTKNTNNNLANMDGSLV